MAPTALPPANTDTVPPPPSSPPRPRRSGALPIHPRQTLFPVPTQRPAHAHSRPRARPAAPFLHPNALPSGKRAAPRPPPGQSLPPERGPSSPIIPPAKKVSAPVSPRRAKHPLKRSSKIPGKPGGEPGRRNSRFLPPPSVQRRRSGRKRGPHKPRQPPGTDRDRPRQSTACKASSPAQRPPSARRSGRRGPLLQTPQPAAKAKKT